MRSQTDKSNSSSGTFLPEYHGATPWVIDMDGDQRRAHAEEMSAHAEKTRAEAAEIRGRNRWNKLLVGVAYAGIYSLVLGIGIVIGILVCSGQ